MPTPDLFWEYRPGGWRYAKKGLPPTFRRTKREPNPKPPPRSVPALVTPPTPTAKPTRHRYPSGQGYGPAKDSAAWMLADPCAYCGEPADTWDHITPRKRGGPHTDNLCRVCFPCNAEKSSRPLLAFLAIRAQRKRDGTWRRRSPSALTTKRTA